MKDMWAVIGAVSAAALVSVWAFTPIRIPPSPTEDTEQEAEPGEEDTGRS